MFLDNLVVAAQLKAGAFLTKNVSDLLSGEGAAGEGQALEQVNQLVEGYGRGIFSISQTVFIYVLAIGMIVGSIGMVVHSKNQQKLSEEKTGFGYKLVAGIIGFAGISIIILMKTIGQSLITID